METWVKKRMVEDPGFNNLDRLSKCSRYLLQTPDDVVFQYYISRLLDVIADEEGLEHDWSDDESDKNEMRQDFLNDEQTKCIAESLFKSVYDNFEIPITKRSISCGNNSDLSAK